MQVIVFLFAVVVEKIAVNILGKQMLENTAVIIKTHFLITARCAWTYFEVIMLFEVLIKVSSAIREECELLNIKQVEV